MIGKPERRVRDTMNNGKVCEGKSKGTRNPKMKPNSCSRTHCVLTTVGFKRIKRKELLKLFVCFTHLLVRAVEIDPRHNIANNLKRILDVLIESR